jgi:nucleoside-diphosphate-sugar epimerase
MIALNDRRRILVTGTAGFIGFHFGRLLLAEALGFTALTA